MADGSKIEWTDATWNPITGCSVVSPGCTNCYAMRLAGTRLQHHPSRAGLTKASKAGPVWNGKVRLNEQWLDQPLRWSRPRRIFVCAHGDLFHESVPDSWIDQVFAVMCLAPWHTFQVLTKRADRMRAYFAETWQPAPAHTHPPFAGLPAIHVPAEQRGDDRWDRINEAIDDVTRNPLFERDRFWNADGSLIGRPAWPRQPLQNVWLGVSAEDQARADERIPHLLATPAAVRWISAEPLLGPLDLGAVPWRDAGGITEVGCVPDPAEADDYRWSEKERAGIRWVIAGGESGPGARPMHPAWPALLRDQCAVAGVPFFFKQWGDWRVSLPGDRGRYQLLASDGEAAARVMLRLAGQPAPLSMSRVGKEAAGRHLDGRTHDAMPGQVE